MTVTRTKIWHYTVFWATCFVYVMLFLMICSSRTGNRVLKFRYAKFVHAMYPSRWGFYTRRTAIEKVYQVYLVQDNKAVLVENRPFIAKLLYGLKRDCKIVACETDIMAKDSTVLPEAKKYTVIKPWSADINKYLRADTLHFTNYHSENVRYLKGKVLVTIEGSISWEQARSKRLPPDTMTVIPVNITVK